MSKGSGQRPRFVSHREYSRRYNAIDWGKNDGSLKGLKVKRFPITEDSKLSNVKNLDEEMDGTSPEEVR